MNTNRPTVLSLSGHDPTGGAGIQADIEAIVSHHCHALSVITALTEQDSHNVKTIYHQPSEHIVKQAQTLLADIPVDMIKVGLLGHTDTVNAIHKILKTNPNIPVVFDPVLAAGGGKDFANSDLISLINILILPYTTVITPNSDEARRLTGFKDLTECGLSLLEQGCKFVLITGGHEKSPQVINQLFHDGQCIKSYSWNRLPHSYHGSGCTLAASIAALMAYGLDPITAIGEAQEYTWNALASGFQLGKGQHMPNRLFWVDDE